MGIGIYGVSNVKISNLTAKDCWGDGCYIGNKSSNVTLDGVTADNNRRQGLSITSADGVVVKNSVFKNTNGTLPMAGIDVEPNSNETNNNIQIINNKMFSNKRSGISLWGPPTGLNSNVLISGNEFYDNGTLEINYFAVSISQSAQDIVITNNNVHDNLFAGIIAYNNTRIAITNNMVTNNGKSPTSNGGGILISGTANNVTVTGNTVTGNIPVNIKDNVGGNTISGNTTE
jgi:parallel beta-helix repeat protein